MCGFGDAMAAEAVCCVSSSKVIHDFLTQKEVAGTKGKTSLAAVVSVLSILSQNQL